MPDVDINILDNNVIRNYNRNGRAWWRRRCFKWLNLNNFFNFNKLLLYDGNDIWCRTNNIYPESYNEDDKRSKKSNLNKNSVVVPQICCGFLSFGHGMEGI